MTRAWQLRARSFFLFFAEKDLRYVAATRWLRLACQREMKTLSPSRPGHADDPNFYLQQGLFQCSRHRCAALAVVGGGPAIASSMAKHEGVAWE